MIAFCPPVTNHFWDLSVLWHFKHWLLKLIILWLFVPWMKFVSLKNVARCYIEECDLMVLNEKDLCICTDGTNLMGLYMILTQTASYVLILFQLILAVQIHAKTEVSAWQKVLINMNVTVRGLVFMEKIALNVCISENIIIEIMNLFFKKPITFIDYGQIKDRLLLKCLKIRFLYM